MASVGRMRSLAIDYERRLIGVELADGQRASAALRSGASADFIARASYDVQADELTLAFRDGEGLTLEVGGRGSLAGGPVVYLDQNHWISLAQHRYAPGKVRSEEREACAALSALAARGDVILPLSGAHAVETARSDGRWRHDLAMTMLGLSHGWQMLSPLKVRTLELARDMSGIPAAHEERTDVFTLEPEALFATQPSREPDDATDLPRPARELARRLTWASTFAETLLEDEIADEQHGPELADKWAQVHGELAEFMRSRRMPREHVRLNAHACVLADLQPDIARAVSAAGITHSELDRWLYGMRTDMRRMPYIGRVEELVYHRLRNAAAAWERNDLNDVHFLCCAAGYADVVVCENETADHLGRAARRATPGAVVCSSLAAGWDALQAFLAR